jgi:hypothetical protein
MRVLIRWHEQADAATTEMMWLEQFDPEEYLRRRSGW